MVVLLLIRNYRQNKLLSNLLYATICLAIPLIIGIAILGWYDWARLTPFWRRVFPINWRDPTFKNITMFSFLRYTSCLICMIIWLCDQEILKAFPFIRSVAGTGASKFPFTLLPKVYFSDSITGMIFSTPFFLLVAVAAIFFILIRKRKEENQNKRDDDKYLLPWIMVSLLGSFLFAFGLIITCFWVVTRYVADFMPPLALLGIIIFWQGYRRLIERPISLKLYQTFGIGLMVISNINSILLALSANAPSFRSFDPLA